MSDAVSATVATACLVISHTATAALTTGRSSPPTVVDAPGANTLVASPIPAPISSPLTMLPPLKTSSSAMCFLLTRKQMAVTVVADCCKRGKGANGPSLDPAFQGNFHDQKIRH